MLWTPAAARPLKARPRFSSSSAPDSSRAVASTSHLPPLPRNSLTATKLSDSDADNDDDPDFGSRARQRARVDAAPPVRRTAKGKKDASAKSKQAAVLEQRLGIRLHAAGDETSDGDSSEENRSLFKETDRKRKGKRKATEGTDSSAAGSSSDGEKREREEHLAGHWRKTKFMKENPGFMSARRRALEEKYNPLIRLLNIKIEVIDSDEERRGIKSLLQSDDSDQSSSGDDPKPKIKVKPDPHKASIGPLKVEDVKMELESEAEPDTEDEDALPSGPVIIKAESDEEEDPMAKRIRLGREAARRKAAAAQAEVAAKRRIQERDEAIARRKAELAAVVKPLEAMDVDEEEPALTMADERRLAALLPKVVYPRPVTKGRPKFMIVDAAQDAIGVHEIAPGVSIPAPVNKFLRSYQREGVEFLYRQYAAGKGAILGDDMGLGKTIQIIAFLSAVMGKTGRSKNDADKRKSRINEFDIKGGDTLPAPSDHGPTALIACPSSVVHNWKREFEVWGYFDVGVFEGNKEEKARTLKKFQLGYLDVLLASIDGVRLKHEELAAQDFTIVVCDEAHRLKNPKSKTTEAFHEFKSKCRIGLTGTPVQNRLGEFWCLLDWANPKAVGTETQWNDYVSRPLKYGQQKDASEDVLAFGRTRAAALVYLLLPTMFLRRTKALIKAQLPKKRDHVVLCPLTPLQVDVYKRLLQLKDVQDILHADDPCPCMQHCDSHGRPYKLGKCCRQDWTELIFKYISLFQKVSNHLALLYPDKEDPPAKYEQDLGYMTKAFPRDHHTRRHGAINIEPELCGKWNILTQLLELWYNNGDKVLLFSMSLKILAFVKELMATTHYPFVSLDGAVPAGERMGLVDQFNNDPDMFCFIISTRAGGVGLNLTAANRVVIFDPNWAAGIRRMQDLQAMDRSYRMGQHRDVDVYRLIGRGTLEELIYNRQQYKRGLGGLAYDASSEQRLFAGVEGEGKEARGDLWGCKNIFTFNEHISLTETSTIDYQLQELEFAEAASAKLKSSSSDSQKKAAGKKRSASSEDDRDDAEPELTDDETTIKRLVGLVKPPSPTKAQVVLDNAVSKILAESGVRTTVLSDSTLGGSRGEEERGRKAIKEVSKQKAKPPKLAWDPSARKKPKSKDEEITETVEDILPVSKGIDKLLKSMTISPDVNLADLIAPSGYKGRNGLEELVKELLGLKEQADYERRVTQILQTYKDYSLK